MRAAFAGIWIAGGGYTEETVGGNLYPVSHGEARLSWNNFDFFCDGVAEALSGGRTLMVCGDGPAIYDETTIVAAIAGSAFVTEGGRREMACSGPHRLTFERVAP